MEEPPLANEPNVPMPPLYNLSDPPNKLAIDVLLIMSKCCRDWIKLVEAAVVGAKPKIAPIVWGDARHVSTTYTIRVPGVMKVAGTAFGCRVEFVHSSVGRNPEIAVIVFYHILNEVGA